MGYHWHLTLDTYTFQSAVAWRRALRSFNHGTCFLANSSYLLVHRALGLGLTLYHALFFLVVSLIPLVAAVSVNITVDDTFGNSDRSVIPAYFPASDAVWHAGSPTEQCAICVIKPSMLDMSQIVDQSWHHGTYFIGTPIQVQVTFPGTAVYVYNVLPNTLPNAITAANISFTLDGETVGLFVHNPDPSSDFLYNKLVYANASLADSLHTLVMNASGSEQSLIFFDYLLYTIEVEETTSPTPAMTSDVSPPLSATAPSAASSTHPPTATIVGGVVGGIALLLAMAALLFLVSRRLRHRRRQTHPDPFTKRSAATSGATTTPSTPTPRSLVRHISASMSNNATVAGPSLAFAPIASTPNIRPSELKRGAALSGRRRDETPPWHPGIDVAMPPARHWEGQRSDSDMSDGLGSGTVHALRGEIAALRNVLSAMAVRGRLDGDQPAEEALPRYEA